MDMYIPLTSNNRFVPFPQLCGKAEINRTQPCFAVLPTKMFRLLQRLHDARPESAFLETGQTDFQYHPDLPEMLMDRKKRLPDLMIIRSDRQYFPI